MKTLTVTKETFFLMVLELIKSGVTFEANEENEKIVIIFTGGF
jgi:hypothetical protein